MASTKDQRKKEAEIAQLAWFLDSYERATGETFRDIEPSETPDFFAVDGNGVCVGIELAQVKFDPEKMHWRRVLDRKDWADDMESYLLLLRLLHEKETKLTKGGWPTCGRKILVITTMDYPLEDLVIGAITDEPDEDSFDEVWVADGTQLDVYRRPDIFPIVHGTLEGMFDVGSRDQKPYG